MEFLLKKETCRDFLNNYHKDIYPILLPKIIEIGILTLKLSFNKVLFSPDELNDMISSLNHQYNLEKQKLNPKSKKTKHLINNNYLTLDKEDDKRINKTNTLLNSISYNDKKTSEADRYLNTIDSSNFYDSNYFIPESKSLRNKQLYNKRLENPMFNTLNKNVYPFWWWNQTEPNYMMNRKNMTISDKKVSKGFNKTNKKDINKTNYFSLKNKTNYKISYDKNFNVIKIEKGKRKNKNNK